LKRIRIAAAALGFAALAFLGARFVFGAIVVGNPAGAPEDLETQASPAARDLVHRALDGLDLSKLLDVHAHVAGSELDGSGCELDARMRSFLHPWRRLQYEIYLRAGGVEHVDRGAAEFADRLRSVARGRVGILALDHRHGEDGSLDRDGTPAYVPNDFVLRLAREHPESFVAVVSVHPYRKDALAELERCAAAGARIVKWIPNSMGIDPADARCDPFYGRMRDLGMTLLAHTGEENALAAGRDDLGNPQRLRRALDAGVRVVFAHCATLGESEDLDDPARRKVANFDLFLRIVSDPRWRALAYGDLSAVYFRNRDPRVVRTLLERTDLHPRLLQGTDWPLPAIRILTSTRRLEQEGLLTSDECRALREVFTYDPWLFDLVLKRTLRGPHGERFPDAVFLERPEIPIRGP
jgi:predicted TIM-barrel fold metal-dependent hydrolase